MKYFCDLNYFLPHRVVSTPRPLRGGPVGDAVAGARVEAEELSADSVIFEAGAASEKCETSVACFDSNVTIQQQTLSPFWETFLVCRHFCESERGKKFFFYISVQMKSV